MLIVAASQRCRSGISAATIFKNEARHDFLGEAALFAVVILTAFLPLISNAHALVESARAIGSF